MLNHRLYTMIPSGPRTRLKKQTIFQVLNVSRINYQVNNFLGLLL